jgi:tetratricopeptide (TPR) repeat protein
LSTVEVDYGQLASHLEMFSERPEVLLEKYAARIRQDPLDAEAYHQRAHALTRLNRPAEAIDDLNQAIHLRPDDVHLRHQRGRLYSSGLRNLEPAIADLEWVLAHDPKRTGVPEALALCCNNQAWLLVQSAPAEPDLTRALQFSQRAVELDPGRQTCLNTRGVVLYRAGRYAEAVQILEQSLIAGKGQFAAFDLIFLAMAHHRLGHRDEARQCYDRAADAIHHAGSVSDEQSKELAAFRAEAESVLAGPVGELPDNVFEEPRP